MKEEFELQVELLQPWSTFVMKTKLPPPILEKMLKITDEIVENPESFSPFQAFASIKEEFSIEQEILKHEDLTEFFSAVIRKFVIQQTLQMNPFEGDIENILNDEWYIEILNMWCISQKDNEYQPIHHHQLHMRSCSSVMYLKIPEYLPKENPASNATSEDGAITFINNTARDSFWGAPSMTIQPTVGDLLIFPASMSHYVNPFRTVDGRGERRSVSFNASFSSKSMQEEERKNKMKH